jgi:hypothetical protein
LVWFGLAWFSHERRGWLFLCKPARCSDGCCCVSFFCFYTALHGAVRWLGVGLGWTGRGLAGLPWPWRGTLCAYSVGWPAAAGGRMPTCPGPGWEGPDRVSSVSAIRRGRPLPRGVESPCYCCRVSLVSLGPLGGAQRGTDALSVRRLNWRGWSAAVAHVRRLVCCLCCLCRTEGCLGGWLGGWPAAVHLLPYLI